MKNYILPPLYQYNNRKWKSDYPLPIELEDYLNEHQTKKNKNFFYLKNLDPIVLEDCDLSFLFLKGKSLAFSKLKNTNFNNAKFFGIDFHRAKIEGCDFSECVFVNCFFNNKIYDCNFTNCSFQRSRIIESAYFENCNFNECSFCFCELAFNFEKCKNIETIDINSSNTECMHKGLTISLYPYKIYRLGETIFFFNSYVSDEKYTIDEWVNMNTKHEENGFISFHQQTLSFFQI